MALSLMPREEATSWLGRWGGAEAGAVEVIAELLRAEVHARGRAPRASTVARVARAVAPVVALDPSRIDEVCDALERHGDVVLSPGGVLHATPLRVVVVGARARVFGSAPRSALASRLGRAIESAGVARSVPASDDLGEAVASLGGVRLSPEAWAGIDRAPRADDAFLRGLGQRLDWEHHRPGALERDGALEWRAWDLTGDAPRWRRGATGRLWWARARFGGHVRAYTAGDSPAVAPFVELGADEADRARFALCRAAGMQQVIGVHREGATSTIDLPGWLPRPEFRWLSLHAEPSAEGRGMRWTLPVDREPVVTQRLMDRLGLGVEVR